jgi:hypothetical protein
VTPQQTLRQIKDLTESLVGLSLCNEQNFPATGGEIGGAFDISVTTADAVSIALKNVSYRDIYLELDKARCFNVKMLDGALMLLRYKFQAGTIRDHSLSYFPSPDLEHFQNDPDLYVEDEIFADVVAKNIVPFPVRFDYSFDPGKFIEVHHPYSHLTLGQYKNCRIPVCSPLGPLAFGGFILRSFYNTAFRKYSDDIPVSTVFHGKSITENEKRIPHLVCGI